MCDQFVEPHREGADPLPMVSTSDLCYLAALFHIYGDVIDWHKCRAAGELETFPVGHQWKDGEPAPEGAEDEQKAIGEQHLTEPAEGSAPAKRHYFEKKPEPKVSVLEAP